MSAMEYWIWFAQRRSLRYKTRRNLLDAFGSTKELYFAKEKEYSRVEGILASEIHELCDKSLASAKKILARCQEENVSAICLGDASYPQRLAAIPDPPCVLYVKGKLPHIDSEPAITMVGTRRSTPYGEKMARSIAFDIASKGGLVVTGLASGIDSCCAEGALMAGGKVVGVLGTAINRVYPRNNARLFDDVAAGGALISEYPPDTPGRAEFFPQRNRIMAALSLGTVVVEAPMKSGALITADRALDYGRDVFAVPGNADAVNSRGCNELLRQGAYITENGWDVLKEYESLYPDKIDEKGEPRLPEKNVTAEEQKYENVSPAKKFFKFRVSGKCGNDENSGEPRGSGETLSSSLSSLTENQLKIVGAITKPHTHVDDIIDLSRLPASTVLSELTMLQIKGFVAQEPGKRFTLNITK